MLWWCGGGGRHFFRFASDDHEEVENWNETVGIGRFDHVDGDFRHVANAGIWEIEVVRVPVEQDSLKVVFFRQNVSITITVKENFDRFSI